MIAIGINGSYVLVTDPFFSSCFLAWGQIDDYGDPCADDWIHVTMLILFFIFGIFLIIKSRMMIKV